MKLSRVLHALPLLFLCKVAFCLGGSGVDALPVGGAHRSSLTTLISGTGIAGTDNTAMTLSTRTIPANTLYQLGDRIRVRAYWIGDTGTGITLTIKINGVLVGHTTDAGAADFQINETWLHYIDATHANIIEDENGALGAVSAANVAGFNWAAMQNFTAEQNQIANNHCVIYALIVDVFPKGAQ